MKTALLVIAIFAFVAAIAAPAVAADPPQLKVGIIGLDTSHVIAFTKELNSATAKPDVAGCRVVAAYPKGSPDIESSTSRVPKYTEDMKGLGVEIVDSIDELLKRVDCVCLETNAGRPHLEQALQVFKAKKPVFIDKPLAGSLADCIALFAAAKKYDCPMFCSSSLRYGTSIAEARAGAFGRITRCETSSPASLEKTHPDLYWYGVHGCEALYAVLGPGCEMVVRGKTADGLIEVTGKWKDGRVGVFREAKGYSGKIQTEKGEQEVGKSNGYRPLIVEFVKMFRGGPVPIAADETIELYAFMEAADESKRQGGQPVKIADVIAAARPLAEKRLAELDK
jgi:predicted dehydrogenase